MVYSGCTDAHCPTEHGNVSRRANTKHLFVVQLFSDKHNSQTECGLCGVPVEVGEWFHASVH